jgi:hypothetical protein
MRLDAEPSIAAKDGNQNWIAVDLKEGVLPKRWTVMIFRKQSTQGKSR